MSELAGDCAARKVAIVSATLYDADGKGLRESERTPERWRESLNPVGTDSLQARLLTHACALARGENPAPPAARAAEGTRIGAGSNVESDDDRARCGCEQHVGLVDGTDAAVDDFHVNFGRGELRQRVG